VKPARSQDLYAFVCVSVCVSCFVLMLRVGQNHTFVGIYGVL